MYLSLANGPLYVVVCDAVGNGVPYPDAVALDQQVVIDEQLDVSVEVACDLVTPLHGDDVQEGAGLVAESVLGEDPREKNPILYQHLHNTLCVCVCVCVCTKEYDTVLEPAETPSFHTCICALENILLSQQTTTTVTLVYVHVYVTLVSPGEIHL